MDMIRLKDETQNIAAAYVLKNHIISPGTKLYVGRSGGGSLTMYCATNPSGLKKKPTSENQCQVWFSARETTPGLFRHVREHTEHTCTTQNQRINRRREYTMKILNAGDTSKVLENYTVPHTKAAKHLDSALQSHAGVKLKSSQLKRHVKMVSGRSLLHYIDQLQLLETVKGIFLKSPNTTFVTYKTKCSYLETEVPMYDGMYLALGDMKRVYEYLPRWSCFDATHVTNVAGGVLQFLSTYNANGHLELLALSVARTESEFYWNRFKEISDVCYQEMSAYIIDNEKGMLQCLQRSKHRFQARTCILHIIKNAMHKGLFTKKDKLVRGAIIAMAKAATERRYNFHAESIKTCHQRGDEIVEYLETRKHEFANYLFVMARQEANATFLDEETGAEIETRMYHNNGSFHGQVTSNAVEQINSVHTDMRAANVIDMLMIYMAWHSEKRRTYNEEARKFKQDGKQVTPWATDKAIAQFHSLKPCTVTIVSNHSRGDWFDCQVNFDSFSSITTTCSVKLVRSLGIVDCEFCNQHVSDGIPCGHAVKCFVYISNTYDADGFASEYSINHKVWYSRLYWVDTYVLQTSILGQSMSVELEGMERHTLLPCPAARLVGRPKKRYEKPYERSETNQRRTITCSKCGKTGHNISTCDGYDNSHQLQNLRAIQKLVENHKTRQQNQI